MNVRNSALVPVHISCWDLVVPYIFKLRRPITTTYITLTNIYRIFPFTNSMELPSLCVTSYPGSLDELQWDVINRKGQTKIRLRQYSLPPFHLSFAIP